MFLYLVINVNTNLKYYFSPPSKLTWKREMDYLFEKENNEVGDTTYMNK